nr:GerMN domain-containing protein [Paenibacillus caui]
MLLAAIAGCGQKQGAAPPESSSSAPSSALSQESSVPQASSEAPADSSASSAPSADGNAGVQDQATETVKVYYADQEFTELKESSREIKYSKSGDAADKYKAAFEALQDSGDSSLVSLWAKMKLLSIQFADGEVTLDIQLPDEARLGTDGELMALDSLKQTLFQFDEVKSIELLVDGKKLESLMGHADLEHPMTRE